MTIITKAWMPDGREREYQRCTRCVMDTTDPFIEFDAQGVCNHCHYFDQRISPNWFPNEEGARRLESLIEEVRKAGKGKDYDSILGISGGVDSSYLAVKVVEWGLRPLVVHVDAGWNSELAVKNIEQIVTKLGLDLVTHVVDWEEMRDLQLAFLRSNVANQDVPQDHAFFAALYNYAREAGIHHVLSGSNYATEGVLPQGWGYDAMDVCHLESIHKQFGHEKLNTFPRLSFFNYHVFYPRIWQMKILAPLNFMPYSKQSAIDLLEKQYGWRYYGGKHYESRWTRFFQAYYLPTKFGYDKRKAHLASLVVSGELSREAALLELEKPLYTDNELAEDKSFVAKKLGIDVDELNALVSEPPRYFTEFPNNQAKLERLHKTMRRFPRATAGTFRLLNWLVA